MPTKNYYKYKNKSLEKIKNFRKNYFKKNKIRPLLKTREKDFQTLSSIISGLAK